MDRLVLELKLPPQDAYFKLLHTLEEVNNLIVAHTHASAKPQRLSPELGNVCFAAGQHGWSFTLASFAALYCARHPRFGLNATDLAKRLWGDWYFNTEKNAFSKSKPSAGGVRTFVQYILEPLYKIYAHTIGETPEDLLNIFKQLGIRMKSSEMHLDPRPLLKLALSRFFGKPAGFVEMVVTHVPSPIDGADLKISTTYTGYLTSPLAQSMRTCASSAPLMCNVVKLYNNPEGNKFLALTRIYSGSITVGQRVKVLGESYTTDDDEDAAVVEVSGISVSVGRYNIEVTTAVAGNWVLLEGVDGPIKKTATITDTTTDASIFKPLVFDQSSVFKLAVEPFNPSELPKMVEGLRRINKTYPLCTTKVEESGEHVILGTGELYMDCVMHDLRHLFSDIEVKVADPVVSFCETVVESSAINCFAETPNKKNKITMLAEPLDTGASRFFLIAICSCMILLQIFIPSYDELLFFFIINHFLFCYPFVSTGLARDIEHGIVSLDWDKKSIGEFFTTKYDWDLLSARFVCCFTLPFFFWLLNGFDARCWCAVRNVIRIISVKVVVIILSVSLKKGFMCCSPI